MLPILPPITPKPLAEEEFYALGAALGPRLLLKAACAALCTGANLSHRLRNWPLPSSPSRAKVRPWTAGNTQAPLKRD